MVTTTTTTTIKIITIIIIITESHQNSEDKRAWARVVLGWVSPREVLVLHPSLKNDTNQ